MARAERTVTVKVTIEGMDQVRELAALVRELRAAGITSDDMPAAVVTARALARPAVMVITDAERAEVAEQLTTAGIVDGDQATCLAILLARSPYSTYREWRDALSALVTGTTDAAVAAELAKTYGSDAVRAACVLAKWRS